MSMSKLSEQLGLNGVLPNALVGIIGSYFQIQGCVGCSTAAELLEQYSGLGIKFDDMNDHKHRLMLNGTNIVYSWNRIDLDMSMVKRRTLIRTTVTTSIRRIMELVGPVITPGCLCPKVSPTKTTCRLVCSSDLAIRVDHLVNFLNSCEKSDDEGADEGDQGSDTESERAFDDDENLARASDTEEEVELEEVDVSF